MARRLVAVVAAAAMLALAPVGDARADSTDVKATTETGVGQWDVDADRSGTPGAWEWNGLDVFEGTWELGGTTYDGELECDSVDPCFTGSTTSGTWDSLTEEGIIDGINFVGELVWVTGADQRDVMDARPHAYLSLDGSAVGTYTRTGTGDDGAGGVESNNLWELDITTDMTLYWCADGSCTSATYPVELDLTNSFDFGLTPYGTYTQTSPSAEPLVDLVSERVGTPSTECKDNGGTRVVDLTSQGVRTALYTYQPSSDEVWVCTRVEDTSNSDGYGGKLVIDSAGADPNVSGGPDSPSTDGSSTACATTTDPPNLVPGSHPIAHGGVGTIDFMVDAYANNQEVWLCLEAGSTQTRVVVPYDDPVPDVSLRNVVTWQPDDGTPGG